MNCFEQLEAAMKARQLASRCIERATDFAMVREREYEAARNAVREELEKRGKHVLVTSMGVFTFRGGAVWYFPPEEIQMGAYECESASSCAEEPTGPEPSTQ